MNIKLKLHKKLALVAAVKARRVILSDNKIDAGLAAANMTLVAEANGPGTLYSGFFTIAVNRFSRLRKALHLSKKQKAAITIVLGYPDIHYFRTAQREKAKMM